MRLALKHQIIMAPAAVLCLMTLLLCFLQFTYWDLSVKRQAAKDLKTAFISLSEAEMAAQRMHSVVRFLAQSETPDSKVLEQMVNLYQHLSSAVERLEGSGFIAATDILGLRQNVRDLNPEMGLNLARFDALLEPLVPQLRSQIVVLNSKREAMGDLHREDIDDLVAQTTFVTIVVLGFAILVGILLSLTFARHILRRIQLLSDSAARITDGDFSPPPAPAQVRDELDGLAVSINRMTDQLIRVVAAEKLLEGAEEERRRIAMDIHDQTLADLSAVSRGLEQLPRGTAGDAVAPIEADLRRATTNLRAVMDDLHPQTLDILGLPAAVESFLEKACQPSGSPDHHFMADGQLSTLKLPRLTQVTVYRIVLEVVNNVLRHAGANLLEVSMSLRESNLVVAVEDNGRGFEPAMQLPTAAGGRGLHNVLERARAIGATASWRTSRFSSGTRFELMLPYREE